MCVFMRVTVRGAVITLSLSLSSELVISPARAELSKLSHAGLLYTQGEFINVERDAAHFVHLCLLMSPEIGKSLRH